MLRSRIAPFVSLLLMTLPASALAQTDASIQAAARPFGLDIVDQVLVARITVAHARIERVPVSGLGFESRAFELTDAEKSTFAAASVTKRIYQVGRDVFSILIIDGTTDRHAVHDPLYCFRGVGWAVVEETEVVLPGGVALRVLLRRNGDSTEALFWFSDGVERHGSAWRYGWQTATRRLTLGKISDEPVLVILLPFGSAAIDWDRLLARFPPLSEV